MKPGRLLVRADADAKIGTGHVMRCIALAQEWQRQGGSVSFLSCPLPQGLSRRIRFEGFELIENQPSSELQDIEKIISTAKTVHADCIVLDGYQFGITYQEAVRETSSRQLIVDDYGHAGHYVADFVLNQNVGAEPALYKSRSERTRLLLGTQYSMLRREFLAYQDSDRNVPESARKFLVTIGGSDPDNTSVTVLRSLSLVGVDGIEARVVIGPANPHIKSLQAVASQCDFGAQLLTSADMPSLMKWADVAISATGTTSYELLFMRLPFVGIAVAGNQVEIAINLHKLTQCDYFLPSELNIRKLGEAVSQLAMSCEKRAEFSKRARTLVDGLGTRRVVTALTS